MYLPKEEECCGVGLGLVLLVDVLLIDTVDANAFSLVDGMEDWYCESVYYDADILTSYDNIGDAARVVWL